MKSIICRKSKSRTSLVFLCIFVSSLFIFQAFPTKAEEPRAEMVWVLTETLVNPYDSQEEFIGGGAQPNWFSEARFEGTVVRYAVTETSFKVDDRWVDHGYEYHNVTIETYFEKPSLKLTPGDTVDLIYGFSHSGTAEDGGTRVQFWYDSDDVDIQPKTVFSYAPWSEGFDGIADGTYSFKVPPASNGGEIEIYASWWNAEPCLVIWKYQAQEASGLVEEEAVPTQQDKPGGDLDAGQEEETANVTVAGFVIGMYGDVYCLRDGKQQKLEKGDQILLGCTIKTGPKGRIRIRVNDMVVNGEWIDMSQPDYRDRIEDAKTFAGSVDYRYSNPPAYINIGTNSEMLFESLAINWGPRQRAKSYVDLIVGEIKIFFRGFNDAPFDVRIGNSICGIRGTEVFISYLPSDDLVYAQALEGHMDVTIETTGETVSLTDHQNLVISAGEIVYTGDVSQEDWDANLEDAGLRDEDFPDSDIVEWETISEDIPDDGNGEDEIRIAPETRSPLAGYIFMLCSILICVGAIVVILVVMYFVHKRSKH